MTEYYSRREKIETSVSKENSNSNQEVINDPLLGVPGSCEPTTPSRGATSLESELCGGGQGTERKEKDINISPGKVT